MSRIKVNIWMTRKCNLACSYCYEGVEKEKASINKKIIDSLIDYLLLVDKDLAIRFHGGEPLLEYELIKYFIGEIKRKNVNKRNITFHITTNGLLVTSNMLEYLIRHMSDISLSIDGGKEVNNMCRYNIKGQGSYDIVKEKSKLLLKYQPMTRARMTFTPDTVKYLVESVEHVVEMGFKVIVAIPDFYDKRWTEKEKELYKQAIEKLSILYKERNELCINLLDRTTLQKYSYCSGGECDISVDTDGSFYPCTMAVGIGEYKIGDIETGVDEEKIKEFQNISREVNPSCKGCVMLSYCSGNRCKIVNKIKTGIYTNPPVGVCMDQHVKYEMYNVMK